jgi:hypothetical protein
MLMFVSELVFLVELALIATGLVILANPETKTNKYCKWAGWILIIGSLFTMLCTAYFSIKYFGQGAFDQALLSSVISV